MPIIFHVYFEDGTSQRITVPPSIWRLDPRAVDKLLITDKTVQRIELDPQRQTADADQSNNHWPVKLVPSRFKLFKASPSRNPMQRAKKESGDSDKPADESNKEGVKKEDVPAPDGDARKTAEKKPAEKKANKDGEEAKQEKAVTPSDKKPESDPKPVKTKAPKKKEPKSEPAGAPQ